MRQDPAAKWKFRPPNRWILLPGLLVAALLAPPSLAASPAGRCLSVDVPWDVTMPDGTVLPAGTLRICHRGDFSPVATIQDIELAGRATGRWMARSERTEGSHVEGPVALFIHRKDSGMILAGYAWPDDRGGSTLLLLNRGSGIEAEAGPRRARAFRPVYIGRKVTSPVSVAISISAPADPLR